MLRFGHQLGAFASWLDPLAFTFSQHCEAKQDKTRIEEPGKQFRWGPGGAAWTAGFVEHEVVLLPGPPLAGLGVEMVDHEPRQGGPQQRDVQHRRRAGRGKGIGPGGDRAWLRTAAD